MEIGKSKAAFSPEDTTSKAGKQIMKTYLLAIALLLPTTLPATRLHFIVMRRLEYNMDTNRPYPEGVAFDEAWRQRQRADRAERIVAEIWETFYGQNMQVANWHQNGELEPMDTFFESNDWGVDKSA